MSTYEKKSPKWSVCFCTHIYHVAACKCRLNAWNYIGGKSDIKPLVRLHVFNGFKLKCKLDTDIMLQLCAQRVIKFDCDWSCQVIRSLHMCLCLCVCTMTVMIGDSVTLGLVLTNYLLLSSLQVRIHCYLIN